MDEQMQKRSKRISAAFGLHPRMRAEEADRWVVVLAVGRLDAQLFDEERSTMFFACVGDVYPDPDDAGNLGLTLVAVRVATNDPHAHIERVPIGTSTGWAVYGYGRYLSGTDDRDNPIVHPFESDALCAAKELADAR